VWTVQVPSHIPVGLQNVNQYVSVLYMSTEFTIQRDYITPKEGSESWVNIACHYLLKDGYKRKHFELAKVLNIYYHETLERD
jgi:hypothetical protein